MTELYRTNMEQKPDPLEFHMIQTTRYSAGEDIKFKEYLPNEVLEKGQVFGIEGKTFTQIGYY